jgi:hypothetical protein
MAIKIDFEGAGEGGFEPIPAGTYSAKVTKVTYHAKAKSSGQPYLEFEFGAIEGQGEKRRLWRNYSLQPQSLWALKQTLTRLGVEVPDGELDIEPEELVGQPCQLVVSVKPHYRDPDKEDNDIDEVLPPGDGASFGWE